MHRIDNATAAVALPTPAAPGTAGYFTEGSPSGGVPATVVDADFMNMLQEELYAVVVAGGQTPTKGTNNQLLAAIQAIAQGFTQPTGIVDHCFGTTPPAGWVTRNGGTIGSAASGATNRANADTAALFAKIWAETSNTGDFVIQDSAGTPTTRGASAAADFAANKRIPLPNDLDNFDRGGNTNIGIYVADTLKSHNHTGAVSAPTTGTLSGSGMWVAGSGTEPTSSTGGAETAPKHRRYLPIIKL